MKDDRKTGYGAWDTGGDKKVRNAELDFDPSQFKHSRQTDDGDAPTVITIEDPSKVSLPTDLIDPADSQSVSNSSEDNKNPRSSETHTPKDWAPSGRVIASDSRYRRSWKKVLWGTFLFGVGSSLTLVGAVTEVGALGISSPISLPAIYVGISLLAKATVAIGTGLALSTGTFGGYSTVEGALKRRRTSLFRFFINRRNRKRYAIDADKLIADVDKLIGELENVTPQPH